MVKTEIVRPKRKTGNSLNRKFLVMMLFTLISQEVRLISTLSAEEV